MEADEKRRKIVKKDGSRRINKRRALCDRGKKTDNWVGRSQTGFESKWVVTVYLLFKGCSKAPMGQGQMYAGNLGW